MTIANYGIRQNAAECVAMVITKESTREMLLRMANEFKHQASLEGSQAAVGASSCTPLLLGYEFIRSFSKSSHSLVEWHHASGLPGTVSWHWIGFCSQYFLVSLDIQR